MFTKSIFFFTWTFPFFHDRFSQYVHIHVIVKYITKITHYIFGELLCVNFLRGAVAVYQIESTRTADGWLDLEEAVYGAVCLVHVSADGADNNNVILLRVNNFLLFVGEGGLLQWITFISEKRSLNETSSTKVPEMNVIADISRSRAHQLKILKQNLMNMYSVIDCQTSIDENRDLDRKNQNYKSFSIFFKNSV